MTNPAKIKAAMMSHELMQAFICAIKMVGIKSFKQTSLFGSNCIHRNQGGDER